MPNSKGFDVVDGEISFNGVPVGFINAGAPSVQAEVIEALREWERPDEVYIKHQAELGREIDDAYDRGYLEGKEYERIGR